VRRGVVAVRSRVAASRTLQARVQLLVAAAGNLALLAHCGRLLGGDAARGLLRTRVARLLSHFGHELLQAGALRDYRLRLFSITQHRWRLNRVQKVGYGLG